ncbi:MAG: protein kinase [Gemmatimonadota bacterium]|nr:MAG: protein kinase [Gemmatimonadota bacterium]
MIGETISHYKILKKLGEGGMGVVYKAKDTKLDRTVALKFLPPELTKDPNAKERFIQEAKTASALQHNNVSTIHEIDETADGQIFISMDFYEGESLQEKIEKGSLDIEEAIDIGTQIAEGLHEAHEKGIVHRDIKSANIMITSKGQAKIMDFGLAKLRGQKKLTKEGTTVGTVAYMSPEQARGDEVDHRTDVWSLGVVLYEMLTGHMPFKGDYDQALIYSILNEDPKPPSFYRTEIPPYLEQILIKMLEKESKNRYQTMQEVLVELNKTGVDSSTSQECQKSIVVLPFKNMSPDKENEYFSDGLTEEIITDLSKIHALRVISRNSAMMLKGSRKSTKNIARELNVQYVLEGSVRKAGNNLRITAQLIDAKDDTHLWADKYSGTLDDVFVIQEKVSNEIVKGLQIKLSPEEKKEIGQHPIQDMRVMECWLRAKQEIHHYTKESLDRAVSMIEDGLEVVGDNALLYWGLGYINWFYVNLGIHLDTKYLNRAEEYVNRIFELDSNSFYGFQLQVLIAYKRGDFKKSIEYTKRALELEPTNPEALDHIIWMYADVGKTENSAKLIDRLLSVDPLTPHNHWAEGFTLMVSGHLEDSVKSFRKCYELESGNYVWRWAYASALYMNKEYDNADAIADLVEKEASNDLLSSLLLFTKYAIRRDSDKALRMVTDDHQAFSDWDELVAWALAQGYALINEKEKSLNFLGKAVNRGFINYPFFSRYDPFLENIRDEERFKKLMEKVKYEWEHFEI